MTTTQTTPDATWIKAIVEAFRNTIIFVDGEAKAVKNCTTEELTTYLEANSKGLEVGLLLYPLDGIILELLMRAEYNRLLEEQKEK